MTALSAEKKQLLDGFVESLSGIEQVRAIVLGGSYATGSATAASDLDIGVYYREKCPLPVEAIKSVANRFSLDAGTVVTGLYEWGPWVNGGAWIKTAQGKVDLLYKNIDQINATIRKAKNGEWENDYDQQPPYGFSSIIFLAETKSCRPLYDPEAIIAEMKNEVACYPSKLRQSVVQQSLWSAEFTLWQAAQFAEKNDAYNTAGCITRALKSIVTALFAINEWYPMGDKRAIDLLVNAPYVPDCLRQRVEEVLLLQSDSLATNVGKLKKLWQETVMLYGHYQSYYPL